MGLIELVENVVPYKTLSLPDKYTGYGCVSQSDFVRLTQASAKQRSRDFEQTLSSYGNTKLRTSFVQLSNCPEGFHFLRDNFVRSHAVHSLVGWLITLGDRHAENLLVSTVTGQSIPIDFGYAFGASAFLAVPELIPFR